MFGLTYSTVLSVVTCPQGTKACDRGPLSMKNALSWPNSSCAYGPTYTHQCVCVCVCVCVWVGWCRRNNTVSDRLRVPSELWLLCIKPPHLTTASSPLYTQDMSSSSRSPLAQPSTGGSCAGDHTSGTPMAHDLASHQNPVWRRIAPCKYAQWFVRSWCASLSQTL